MMMMVSIVVGTMVVMIVWMMSVIVPTTTASIIHNTKSTQTTLQIIPTPFRTTAMTKVCSSTQLDIQLVHIIKFSISRFRTEWTFFHDDMGRCDTKVVIVCGEVGELLTEVRCDLLGG